MFAMSSPFDPRPETSRWTPEAEARLLTALQRLPEPAGLPTFDAIDARWTLDYYDMLVNGDPAGEDDVCHCRIMPINCAGCGDILDEVPACEWSHYAMCISCMGTQP